MEDSQIIELYWQKSEEAIKETERKYKGYCFAIANHILRNYQDSEECVNDTWLNAWNAIPPQKPKAFQIFLAKITRNLSFNRFNARSAQKRGSGEIDLVLDELAECLSSESDVEKSSASISACSFALYRRKSVMCSYAATSSRTLYGRLRNDID